MFLKVCVHRMGPGDGRVHQSCGVISEGETSVQKACLELHLLSNYLTDMRACYGS